jgi:hypothetical protein
MAEDDVSDTSKDAVFVEQYTKQGPCVPNGTWIKTAPASARVRPSR